MPIRIPGRMFASLLSCWIIATGVHCLIWAKDILHLFPTALLLGALWGVIGMIVCEFVYAAIHRFE